MHHIFGYALLVLLVVIVVRPAWIFFNSGRNLLFRTVFRREGVADGLTWQQNLVLSWAGMRGVVTLAAAAGVPFTTVLGPGVSAHEEHFHLDLAKRGRDGRTSYCR